MFKELKEILDNITLNITIVEKQGELTVSVLPKSKDKTINLNLAPIVICGTPEELDKNFKDVIFSAFSEKNHKTISNVEAFEKSLQKEDEEKKAKKEKAVEKKETKEKPATEKLKLAEVTPDLFAAAPSLPPIKKEEVVEKEPETTGCEVEEDVSTCLPPKEEEQEEPVQENKEDEDW